MGTPVTVRNATDTWVNSDMPSKPYGEAIRLWMRSAHRIGLLYFNRAWNPGSTIISAKLRVYNTAAWAGSVTLTVQRSGSKWDASKVHYSNKPNGTGPTAVVTKTGAAAGTMWEFDVAPILQPVANGQPWYGFIITTNSASNIAVHSQQSSSGTLRPVLILEWNDPPDEPDNLRPAGGRYAGKSKPYLVYDFNDDNGDTDLMSHQVQFGVDTDTLDTGVSTWDSGEVPTAVPEADLSNTTDYPTFAALADNAVKAWRVRTKDASGVWSPYSDSVDMGYASKGVLTITTDFIWSGNPTVSWTFTGRTQKAYQVAIADTDDHNRWLWDSGKITGTDTSVGVPWGVIDDATAGYTIIVRVWDDVDRESLPGDKTYVEALLATTIAYDDTVVPVSGLAAVSDAMLPVEHLTWTDATAPDEYQIQRSSDGGVTWNYRWSLQPADLNTGGTNYAFDDTGARPYTAYQWRVLRIVGEHQSDDAAVVSGQVRHLAPFLMRKDHSDACCFLNPKRSKSKLDIQELLLTKSGPPILQTQRLGLESGHIEGRFTDGDAMTGVTAYEQSKRFESMRKDSGAEMILVYANQTFTVIAYNMQIDTLTDSAGITYLATFDWFQVPR